MSPEAKKLYDRLQQWAEAMPSYKNYGGTSYDHAQGLRKIAEDHDAAVEAHWSAQAEAKVKAAEESARIVREASAKTISDYQKQIAELTK